MRSIIPLLRPTPTPSLRSTETTIAPAPSTNTTRRGYTPAPLRGSPPTDLSHAVSTTWVQRVVEVVNTALSGHMNVTLDVTLDTASATTTVIDRRISAFSALLWSPLTANAAAIASSVYVNMQKAGQAILSHDVTADTDCDFRLLIIG